ncbi:hypothetical protein T492DRAFT_636534 [Pavlovales sp. CCMP2436]|nr:hypothetical protein T492DRAFT_636534 [Pavlovales sp. CCMP2436]
MWLLLLAAALGLGCTHQLGVASLRLPVDLRPAHDSAFAYALRPSLHPELPRSSPTFRMHPDGFGTRRSARATMCAQPAELPKRRAVSPRELTSLLASADSLTAILDVYKRHGSSFNEINVATAWNRLGKVRATGREGAGFFSGEESALLQLLQHTEKVIPRLDARNIAGACYGMARLRFEPARATMRLLGAEATTRLGEFKPQNLANTAWAFAKLGVPAPQLFDAIARESEQRIGSFNEQNLANTAWAFATVGIPAPRLFEAIARESEQRIGSFKPQELANTAWSFATLGVRTPQLFEAIACESEKRVGSFKPQEIANTAWAFATLSIPAPHFFDAIERESEQRIGSFNPQELANTAWASATLGATLGVRAPQLFDAIARETEQRVGSFKPQELANTAWAFTTIGMRAPQLFDAIARESEQRIDSFMPQGLANTAWAFATIGVRAPQLFDAIARESEERIGTFEPQGLANTAWAFAIAGTAHREALVKAVCARAVEIGLPAFSGDERCQLHQFFLGVELEVSPSTELLAPIGLRDVCRQAMADYKPARSSKLHEDVSCELTRMGIAHANELCVPRLGYHVDIAILPAAETSGADADGAALARRAATAKYAGIVIEVDGPSHYNDERRLRPASEMIRRHLALAGWAVLSVPYWEWDALKSKGKARKAEYLTKLLARAAGSKPGVAQSAAVHSRE